VLHELKEKIHERGGELVDKLFDIADELPRLMAAADGFTVVGPSHSDRIKAIGMLLAYGYGRPVQAVEHSGKDGAPLTVNLEGVPLETIKVLRERMLAAGVAAANEPEQSPDVVSSNSGDDK
jgi:hypothetical protein